MRYRSLFGLGVQERLPLYRVYGVPFALWIRKGSVFDSTDVCCHATVDLFANVGEMAHEPERGWDEKGVGMDGL